MRNTVLIALLLISLSTFAQTKTPVLLLSTKAGKLMVDGGNGTSVRENEPVKLFLDEGDHILQLDAGDKTLTGVVSHLL